MPGEHSGDELAAAADAELVKAAVRCSCTVLADMCSSLTIWRVECPLATRATTRDWAVVRP
jgi:hypothetical protein